MTNRLQQAITAIQEGNTEIARLALIEIINSDPLNEHAWVWMATVVEFDEIRQQYLEKALEINPNNKMAQEGLAILQAKPEGSSPKVTSPRIDSPQPAPSMWTRSAKVVYLAIFIGSLLLFGVPMGLWVGISSNNPFAAISAGLLVTLFGAFVLALPVAIYVAIIHYPYQTMGILKILVRLGRLFR